MGDFWGNTELHNDPEQIKRQTSARDKKLTPVNIDFANSIGYFKGSGKNPYTATLTDCSCGDFIRRRLPCKHMYRLAHEINVGSLGSVEESNVVVMDTVDGMDLYLDKTTGEITEKVNIDILKAKLKANVQTLNLDELRLAWEMFRCFTTRKTFDFKSDELTTMQKFINYSFCNLKSTKKVIKNDDIKECYKYLDIITTKLYYSNFIKLGICEHCFEEKFEITLNPNEYIYNNSFNLMCASCSNGISIRISKLFLENNPELVDSITEYLID